MNNQPTKDCNAIVLSANTSWYLYNFRSNLISELISRGYDVSVFAPKDQCSHLLQHMGCRYIGIKIDRHGLNPLKDLLTILSYWRQLRAVRSFLLVNFTIKPVIYGGLAARVLKQKTVSIVPGLGTAFIHPGWVTQIVNLLYRLSLKKSIRVGFENSDDLDLFKSRKMIEPRQGFRIAGPGVDTKKFRFTELPNNEVPIILFAGRLVWEKGLFELIKAIEDLQNKQKQFRVQVLGPLDSGNPRSVGIDNINGWVERRLIEYLGETNDVRPYIRQADCVVLPSYREGLPGVLLEACAIGRPMIATNVPGCNEIILATKSIGCEPRSVRSLSDAIERFLALSHEERKVIAQNARRVVCSTYSQEVVNKKYIELIDSIWTQDLSTLDWN
jgi:glycosyltransferase involved in cell wall biosynthesis